ncbi:phytanoyl-CoA dioxygenase family protein [Flavihumibacter profundi]|jgi:phytanoyl-CoA hydroxylase|uniref:phytanoyl-CoA dioxygenase family protein n=1 Tax=Flavihumibacter profundi TaxID=2716883 RepID=UPI001CC41B2F|nr:phytanoyl-CoA dioxygenase family protein [Flavihumibacter profundi]MBZ5859363.1 phytanoyl-CoA dioxygenase family protein [Flavihumibacter profundi]
MSKIEDPKFVLGDQLTAEQVSFFNTNGFIIFRDFISPEKVRLFINETERIEKEWLAENREKVNGVPLKFGVDDKGNKMIQRLCFLSLYSEPLRELLNDPKLQLVTQFLSPYEGRIAEDEKDGLVLNHYINSPKSTFTQMGWHTDSPRDLFLGQKIMPMLNVGIHLNDCPFENGGLRLLPGTHTQGIFRLLFRKKYFVDHTPDPKEVGFDVFAGDLTVHDGRLWHRAQSSPLTGEKSRRRVMYVPVITGKYIPKHENSKTPFYHRLASRIQN